MWMLKIKKSFFFAIFCDAYDTLALACERKKIRFGSCLVICLSKEGADLMWVGRLAD